MTDRDADQTAIDMEIRSMSPVKKVMRDKDKELAATYDLSKI